MLERVMISFDLRAFKREFYRGKAKFEITGTDYDDRLCSRCGKTITLELSVPLR